MKEYIERASVHSIIEQTSAIAFTRGGMHKKIDSLPAADVAEVVRCKDCKYCDYKSNVIGCACFRGGLLRNTKANDFCSYGERRNKK